MRHLFIQKANYEILTWYRRDRPGRGYESSGPSRRAICQPKTDPKKHEIMDFAKTLSKHLDSGRKNGSFQSLYVAATPFFLGILRQSMDKLTSQLIDREIDKDIIHLTPDEIKAYFTPY